MQSPVCVEKQVRSICLADSTTTHIILQDNKYFTHLSHCEGHVTTILGTAKLIEGSRRASILLPMGTEFFIKDAYAHQNSNIIY